MVAQTMKGRALDVILTDYNGILTYDEWKDIYLIEEDGNIVDLNVEGLSYTMLAEYDIDIAPPALGELLKKNAYTTHSLRDYLGRVWLDYGTNNAIDTLCKEILKCGSQIEEIYIKKFLVSAVARMMEPGCKVDNMLVLQSSKGGLGKTSFFTELAGIYNFTSVPSKISDVELRKLCSNFWIVEFGEIETIVNRRNIADFKTFLTCQVDSWRKFYNTSANEQKARNFVCCGTTNKDKFLCDTASINERRFWVVKITDYINNKWVTANRDRIWAEAMHLYKEGYQWWLTPEEEAMNDSRNESFKEKSSFESIFSTHIDDNYITENKPFVLSDVLKDLDLSPAKYAEAATAILERQFKLVKPVAALRRNNTRRRWWNLKD